MNIKTTSRTALLILALASLPTFAAHPGADGDQRPPRGEPRDLSTMTEQLQLSEDEAQAFRTLLEKHHAERRAMHEENRDGEQELRQRHQSEMSELLSEEQFKTFESLRPKRQQRKHR